MGNCFGSSSDSGEYEELKGVAETPHKRNYGATSRVDTRRLGSPATAPNPDASDQVVAAAAPNAHSTEGQPLLGVGGDRVSTGQDDESQRATFSQLVSESREGTGEDTVRAKLNFEEIANSESQNPELVAAAAPNPDASDQAVAAVAPNSNTFDQFESEHEVIEEVINGGSSGQVGEISYATSEELRIEEQILRLISENNYEELSTLLASDENLLTANLFEEQSLIRYAFKNQNTDLISCIFKLYNSYEFDNKSLIDEVYEEIKNFHPNEDIQSIFDEANDILRQPYIQAAILILQKSFIKNDSLDNILNFYLSNFECPEIEICDVIYTISLVVEMLKYDERASVVYRKILENYKRYDAQIIEFLELISKTMDIKAIAESVTKNRNEKMSLAIIKELLQDDSNREVVLKVVAPNNNISISVLEYMMRKNKLTAELLEVAVEHGLDLTLNTKIKVSGQVQERPFISTINQKKCNDSSSLEHKMVLIFAKTEKFKTFLGVNYKKYIGLDSCTEQERKIISAELKPFNKIIPILNAIENINNGFILSLGLSDDLKDFLLNPTSFSDTGSLISYGDNSLHSISIHNGGPAAGYAIDDTHTVSGDIDPVTNE